MAIKKTTTAANRATAPNRTVETSQGGPNAYAMEVLGDQLAPTVTDGQFAIFDPDAGRALRGEVVALWVKGETKPFVVRLATAVPPLEVLETDGALGVETRPGACRFLSMARVARVDRLVQTVDAPRLH
ncbi:hypothetical protein CDN99_26005 [Roseateles aquatilis]|uniref:Uncharacterized protein n=1 Tax=Roseateles aquatilis TaxID=431061 RepID=A0A246IUA4_9BURK|nr:S24/S26 family peptidase [Roseateles aquatilis]OWQ83587.1 hypothetical protein CDN99_26005 [Roseateles aquatilis]